MNRYSLPLTLALAILVFVPSLAVVTPAAYGTHFGPSTTPVLQVWFDAAPQLTIAYPPAYLFNVAAKTANGLWITTLHWDFGDGATLDVPFSAQSQVSDIRAHQYANQANYCVTVTAYDSAGNSASASQPLMPPHDFTLNASPPTQTVSPGGATSYSVAVGPGPTACGQPVTVNLVISTPPPQGVTWTLNPSSGQTTFSSALQVQTSTTTPNGTYTINVVGTSGNVTHTSVVTLIVTTPTVSLSIPPTAVIAVSQTACQQGTSNTTTLIVQSVNGFNSPVSLSALGAPSGTTITFSPATVTPPPNGQASSVVTIVTSCSLAAGTYLITIQGTGNGVTRQMILSLIVSGAPAPSFDLFWWILLGIVSLLVLLPLLFLFLRRPPVVVPVPAPMPVAAVAPAPPVAVPQFVPCPICGNPLSPADGRWYCGTCHRRIFIAP